MFKHFFSWDYLNYGINNKDINFYYKAFYGFWGLSKLNFINTSQLSEIFGADINIAYFTDEEIEATSTAHTDNRGCSLNPNLWYQLQIHCFFLPLHQFEAMSKRVTVSSSSSPTSFPFPHFSSSASSPLLLFILPHSSFSPSSPSPTSPPSFILLLIIRTFYTHRKGFVITRRKYTI